MKIYIDCQSLSEYFGVIKAQVTEAVNSVTMVELELVSKNKIPKQDLEDVLGKAITLFVEDVIDRTLHKVRWDGVVFEFAEVTTGEDNNGFFYYTMVMRPKLWNLNYFTNCRSYPNMSRIDVIEDLLKSHDFSQDVHYCKKYYNEDVYPSFYQLLQTGNSDLNFFKSLVTNAGINFYFACDNDGEQEEMLQLVDDNAFFPTFENEISIVRNSGLVEKSRQISEITRLTKAIPKEIKSTAFLADGSTNPIVNSTPISNTNTNGTVEMFVPEGHSDADKTARRAGKVAGQGFEAQRIQHQGVCNYIRVRPGNRISVKDSETLESYKVLVTKVSHDFEQTVLAALSGEGSGDVSYKNYFLGIEPNAPIHPTDCWQDVDINMSLDSCLNLNIEGNQTINPKYKYSSNTVFNSENEPHKNTEGIKQLLAIVAMQQEQIQTLKTEVKHIKASLSANGSGLITAEITKDAWVTQGNELVCMVTAEEFEDPIVVKVAVSWHDKGGGSLHLPRVGNHVWIQRIHRSKGNDWVIVGYRPTGTVAASNNPSNSFSVTDFD